MAPLMVLDGAPPSLRIPRRDFRKKRPNFSSTASFPIPAKKRGKKGSWSATVFGRRFNSRHANVVPALGRPVRTMSCPVCIRLTLHKDTRRDSQALGRAFYGLQTCNCGLAPSLGSGVGL